jgi:hypothetical protein
MDLRAVEEGLGISLNLSEMRQGALALRHAPEEAVRSIEALVAHYDAGPWIRYDTGARVSYYHGRTGEPGGFLMDLPAGYADMAIHRHEFSDRVILARKGAGMFFHIDEEGTPREYPVTRGTVLAFPLRTWHRFTAGPQGLLCADFHTPFFPIGHPLFQRNYAS